MFLDGYAHTYVIDIATENFFTPWHMVFYAGFTAFVFAIGGVGDGIWHTVFGIELGIDALLSPTHLLLFWGAILVLWTPVRSLAERGVTGRGSIWLAVCSACVVTALFSFAIQYLWFVPWMWFAQQSFDAASGTGQGLVVEFLAGSMVTTLVLLGPLLVVAGRWRLPSTVTSAGRPRSGEVWSASAPPLGWA